MIPPSTTITERGRRIRRILLGVLALIVGLNLVVWLANSFTSGGAVAGPDGSSYVTRAGGAAAAAGMLERLGVTVERSRTTLDSTPLARGDTLVMVDVGAADYSSSELNALEDFMSGGGRVVVAGQAPMVERLFADSSTWQTQGGRNASPLPGLGPVAGLSSFALSGFGSLDPSPADVPIFGDGKLVVGVTRPVGDGSFWWLADPGPFHNEAIGRPDAAVAVYTLIGPTGTVVFDEYHHGYVDDGSLWQVLPSNWRTALLLGAAAALVALVAYARRFGPPHDERRHLAPGREAYLEAVAGMMVRGGADRDALELIREEIKAQLAARGSNADAKDSHLDEAQIRAVTGSDDDDDTLLAADHALAALTREKR
jgi:hypothetical protein